MRHALVLLNANAGTLLERDADQVKKLVETKLGNHGREIEVRLLAGEQLTRAIKAAGRGAHDTVIVGGGDGSVSLAARCLTHSDKTLGILPLGTINLLARDIGMPFDLDEALDALAHARPTKIDLGSLNGDVFHTISGMGFFSQMARAREAARHIRIGPLQLGRFAAVALAAFYALRRTGRVTLDIRIDDLPLTINAFAALVTVNRFKGNGWRRSRLDGGMLEVHIAEDRGALAMLKAGADMMTDSWRDNPGIHSFTGREIVIARRNRNRTWVSTDGELGREKLPLRYKIHPASLKLLIPPRKPETEN